MTKIQNPQDAAVVEAVSKTEQFFQENGKKVVIALVAVVAVAVAAYILIKKYVDSKRVVSGNDAENYVSCSCCDDTFVSETVA
jgi:hypothetical protein